MLRVLQYKLLAYYTPLSSPQFLAFLTTFFFYTFSVGPSQSIQSRDHPVSKCYAASRGKCFPKIDSSNEFRCLLLSNCYNNIIYISIKQVKEFNTAVTDFIVAVFIVAGFIVVTFTGTSFVTFTGTAFVTSLNVLTVLIALFRRRNASTL